MFLPALPSQFLVLREPRALLWPLHSAAHARGPTLLSLRPSVRAHASQTDHVDHRENRAGDGGEGGGCVLRRTAGERKSRKEEGPLVVEEVAGMVGAVDGGGTTRMTVR